MKCNDCRCCQALHRGYESDDEYCLIRSDDDMPMNGCFFSKKTIDKKLKIAIEEDVKAFGEDCKGFVDFMEQEKKKQAKEVQQ